MFRGLVHLFSCSLIISVWLETFPTVKVSVNTKVWLTQMSERHCTFTASWSSPLFWFFLMIWGPLWGLYAQCHYNCLMFWVQRSQFMFSFWQTLLNFTVCCLVLLICIFQCLSIGSTASHSHLLLEWQSFPFDVCYFDTVSTIDLGCSQFNAHCLLPDATL